MTNVNVYVFSSKTITNIWAGYGARTWAVAEGGSESSRKGKVTKARMMSIGSFGILYCEPWKSYTVPFVTTSDPDLKEAEMEIWSGSWVLPFSFMPLGSPRRKISGDKIKKLPGAMERKVTNFGHYLSVRGDFVFQASSIDVRDWKHILSETAG